MHAIEPYFNWRGYYTAETDPNSPFYKRTYNEFGFTNALYNYAIHPQWDDFGSSTLFSKLLYVDYQDKVAVIELLGEWNDCIGNDIMYLKREVIDPLIDKRIDKFIVIGENVLNFHPEGDDYYEEWFSDIEDGWIAALNFQPHVLAEFESKNLDSYLNLGGELDNLNWRTFTPEELVNKVSGLMQKRLGSG